MYFSNYYVLVTKTGIQFIIFGDLIQLSTVCEQGIISEKISTLFLIGIVLCSIDIEWSFRGLSFGLSLWMMVNCTKTFSFQYPYIYMCKVLGRTLYNKAVLFKINTKTE